MYVLSDIVSIAMLSLCRFSQVLQTLRFGGGTYQAVEAGISLRLDERSHLCNLIDNVNNHYPSLGQALPCYYGGDDHHNQLG